MWLPNIWPSYYSKAKGCEVWDIDGNHYYDMSIMGVGANVLGYAFDEVEDAVNSAIIIFHYNNIDQFNSMINNRVKLLL